MTDDKDNSIHNKVLSDIESGKIKMRPKWHYILRGTLLFLGVTLVVLALLFFGSLLVFSLRRNGSFYLPAFGFREFIFDLPWLIIALSIIFIVILEILVRKFSFAYKRPLLYSIIGVLLLVALGGVLIDRTGFHEGLYNRAGKNPFPFGKGLYRMPLMRGQGRAILGIITEKTNNGFKMLDMENETLNVTVSKKTRYPLGSDFEKGDAVMVLGQRQDNNIKAEGIREIGDMHGFIIKPLPQPYHGMMPAR